MLRSIKSKFQPVLFAFLCLACIYCSNDDKPEEKRPTAFQNKDVQKPASTPKIPSDPSTVKKKKSKPVFIELVYEISEAPLQGKDFSLPYKPERLNGYVLKTMDHTSSTILYPAMNNTWTDPNRALFGVGYRIADRADPKSRTYQSMALCFNKAFELNTQQHHFLDDDLEYSGLFSLLLDALTIHITLEPNTTCLLTVSDQTHSLKPDQPQTLLLGEKTYSLKELQRTLYNMLQNREIGLSADYESLL